MYIHIHFYFLILHLPLEAFILKYHVSYVILSGLLLRICQQQLPYTAQYIHLHH